MKVNKMAKFCTNCGTKIEAGQEKCLTCGKQLIITEKPTKKTTSANNNNTQATGNVSSKSKVCAGLLALFVGSLGVHNFYLGYTSKGVAQLLLTLVGWVLCGLGPIIASVWAFVEAIMILTGSINKDADGNELVN